MGKLDELQSRLDELDANQISAEEVTGPREVPVDELQARLDAIEAGVKVHEADQNWVKDVVDVASGAGRDILRGAAASWDFLTGLVNTGIALNTMPHGMDQSQLEAFDAEVTKMMSQHPVTDVMSQVIPDLQQRTPGTLSTVLENVGGAMSLPLGGLAKLPAEVGLSALGGTAQGVTEQLAPGHPGLAFGANALTSVATPSLAKLGALGYRVMPLRGLFRTFTEKGQRKMAAEIIAAHTEDIARARANLETPVATGTTPLTVAQRARDQGLLRLEGTLRATRDSARSRFLSSRVAQDEHLQGVLDSIADTGNIFETGDYLKDSAKKLNTFLDKRVQAAILAAQDTVRNLGPKLNREELGAIARGHLETALEDARQTESTLYAAVPQHIQVNPTTLRARYEELRNPTTRAAELQGEATIPQAVHDWFTRGADDANQAGVIALTDPLATDSVQELQGFRSWMLDEQRAALANNNFAGARLYRELAVAALEDLGIRADRAATNGAEHSAALLQAITFSRRLNDTFTRGPIGRILRVDPEGGDRVAEAMTVEALVKPGVAGGPPADALREASAFNINNPAPNAAADQMLRAWNGRQAVDQAVQASVVEMFRDAVVNFDGSISKPAMEQFLKKYQPLLSRYPDLQSALSNTQTAQNMAEQLAKQAETLQGRLGDKARSRAALFLDDDADRAFQQALKGKNQRKAFAKLVEQTKRDPSGRALEGLKRAFIQELTVASRSGSDLLPSGEVPIRYPTAQKFLEDNKDAAIALFAPQERTRLATMMNDLNKIEGSVRAGTSTTPITTTDSLLVSLARIGAAHVATSFGTANSLVTSSAATRGVTTWLKNFSGEKVLQLVEDAMFDEKLFKVLTDPVSKLKPEVTDARMRFVYQHLISSGAITGRGTEDERQSR